MVFYDVNDFLLQCTIFFIRNSFFFNLALMLRKFFMNWASNVAKVWLNTNNHNRTVENFVFNIFLSISRSRFIYVVSMKSIFHFQPHFHLNQSYNPIKTDTLVFAHFLEYLLVLWMVTWMKKVNTFKIAGCSDKVQIKFSLRVLLKVYLIFSQYQPGIAYESVAYKKNV